MLEITKEEGGYQKLSIIIPHLQPILKGNQPHSIHGRAFSRLWVVEERHLLVTYKLEKNKKMF